MVDTPVFAKARRGLGTFACTSAGGLMNLTAHLHFITSTQSFLVQARGQRVEWVPLAESAE
jgi:hypothetical protein